MTSHSPSPASNSADQVLGAVHRAQDELTAVISGLADAELSPGMLARDLGRVLQILEEASSPQVITGSQAPVPAARAPRRRQGKPAASQPGKPDYLQMAMDFADATPACAPSGRPQFASVLPRLSDEQNSAIESGLAHDQCRVIAPPGSGKTTLLIGYAERRPGKGIYLAYNQDIRRDAETRFPRKVLVRTSHALAFAAVGAEYAAAGKPVRDFYVQEIAEQLLLQGEDRLGLAFAIREAYSTFANSIDERVSSAHISPALRQRLMRKLRARNPTQDFDTGRLEELLARVVRGAQELWDHSTSKTSATAISHDAYLKLWMQQGVRLLADFLLVDEYQDTNPVLQAILAAQEAPIMVVGDPFQSLYSWRGAINALDTAPGPVTRLTKCFRFGKTIAEAVNTVLRLRGAPATIQGCARDPGRVGPIDSSKPYALLARTNAALCLRAALLAPKVKVCVVGGAQELVSMMKSAWGLYTEQPELNRHHLLSGFRSYGAFRNYVAASNDRECSLIARLIDDHGGRLDGIIAALESGLVPESEALAVLSTVHRAKGREFDQVMLDDDFPDIFDSRKMIKTEEANVLHVGMSRARKVLQPNQRLQQMLAGPEPAARRTLPRLPALAVPRPD